MNKPRNTTAPLDFTEQSVTPEQIVLGTARLDSHFRKWLVEQLTSMGDSRLRWEPSPRYVADFTEQARQLVTADWDEEARRRYLPNEVLVQRIASALAEAATQGQVVGIERAVEHVYEMASATFDETRKVLIVTAKGIGSLSPDPSYLNRVRNEVRRQAGIEAFTDAVSIVSQSLNGDDAIAKLKELIAAIGDDSEHGNRD